MSDRTIRAEEIVEAQLLDVWEAWTTKKGITGFFAPDCDIDLRPGGRYEIYFNPDAPYGEKGGEGLRILAIDPGKMLSFTWNAPPSLPNVRQHRTHVTVRFVAKDETATQVSVFHDGWGTGEEWDKAYDYFSNAWERIVLPRLKYLFKAGPVDWANPPAF